MSEPAVLLAAYDDELRTDAETPGALQVTQLGPLRVATYPAGQGFVTYRDLTGGDVGELVAEVVDHCRTDPEISSIEWKTRGHDHTPGLPEALTDHGFTAGEPEAIMIGPARLLAVHVGLPATVTLRRIREHADVLTMSAMLDEVFGDSTAMDSVAVIQQRLDAGGRHRIVGRRGRSAGHRSRSSGTGSRHTVRRLLGWRGAARMAGARDLPRIDLGPRTLCPSTGQDVGPQRFIRILPSDPRTCRTGEGVDHHGLPLAVGSLSRVRWLPRGGR